MLGTGTQENEDEEQKAKDRPEGQRLRKKRGVKAKSRQLFIEMKALSMLFKNCFWQDGGTTLGGGLGLGEASFQTIPSSWLEGYP